MKPGAFGYDRQVLYLSYMYSKENLDKHTEWKEYVIFKKFIVRHFEWV